MDEDLSSSLSARPRPRIHTKHRLSHSLKINESIIWVKHLPAGWTEVDLTRLAAKFGNVLSAQISRDPDTNEELHKGKIIYKTPFEADRALHSLDGMEVDGHQLSVGKSDIDNAKERASLKILVKRIPNSCNEDTVKKVFETYGDITKLLRLDEEEENSWICTIEFKTYEAANAAKQEMNKASILPGTPPISVKFTRAKARNEEIQQIPLSQARRNSSFMRFVPDFV